MKWRAVEYALKHGRFNYLEFFPHGSKAKYFRHSEIGMLFSEWWDQWISELSIRRSTERSYRSRYRNHIQPYFGSRLISSIEKSDVLVFRRKLQNTLQPNSINLCIRILCQCFLEAFRRKLISEYPCEGIGALQEGQPQIDPFSFDELKHWLGYLANKNTAWHDLILFWSRTGLRPGELCALRWEHIDYFNRKALIREAKQENGSMGLPKTRHSIRDIDLRPAVIEALKRQEARTLMLKSYVWMNEKQQPWTRNTMHIKFSHWLLMAKLKHRPPKQMRHTFATLHLGSGENPSWVANMLGHASVEITLKTYNRFLPNLTREDGSAFEKIMDSKGQIGNDLVYDLKKSN